MRRSSRPASGSGALSLWLLRAIGAEGRLLSFERREEFAEVARSNVAAFTGVAVDELPGTWTIGIGDLVDELPKAAVPASVDRVILDMLAPWECLDAVADALMPGGVLLCYVATVTQLSRIAEAIRGTGLLHRPESRARRSCAAGTSRASPCAPTTAWSRTPPSCITARRLAPDAVLPAPARRASKTEYGDEDVELWTPGAVGDRVKSDKRVRKVVREARTLASRGRAPDLPQTATAPTASRVDEAQIPSS